MLTAEEFGVTLFVLGIDFTSERFYLVLYLLGDESLLTRSHLFVDSLKLTGNFVDAMDRLACDTGGDDLVRPPLLSL